MNKHILLVTILLSHYAVAMQNCPEVHWVAVNRDFTITTQLAMTPSNYERWELINYNELELISYTFISSKLFGSAGTQEWVFRASRPGFHQVKFARNNITKAVSVNVYKDILWCGKREPVAPIIF